MEPTNSPFAFLLVDGKGLSLEQRNVFIKGQLSSYYPLPRADVRVWTSIKRNAMAGFTVSVWLLSDYSD